MKQIYSLSTPTWLEALGRWHLATAIAITLFFIIFGHRFSNTQEVHFDIVFLEQLRQFIPREIGEVLRWVYIGTGAKVTACLVVASLIYLLWRRYWSEAKYLALATLGILLLIDQVLKPIFNRRRPLESLVEVNGRSFPSGHAAGSIVFYFYLATLLAVRFPLWRYQIFAAATLWVALIGLSSMYCRVHWPSDILAGYAIGYVWLVVSLAFLKRAEPQTYWKSIPSKE